MIIITHISERAAYDGRVADLINKFATQEAIFKYIDEFRKNHADISRVLTLDGAHEYLIERGYNHGLENKYWEHIIRLVHGGSGVSHKLFEFVLSSTDHMTITRNLRTLVQTGRKMQSDRIYTLHVREQDNYCICHTIELLGKLGLKNVIVEFDHCA